MNSQFQFLSVSEVASLLKVTTGRVRQLLGSGELSGNKLGEKQWAIHIDAIDAYKRRRRRPGRPTVDKATSVPREKTGVDKP